LPQNEFSERRLRIDNAFPDQKRSFHVEYVANTDECCQ
jgi:hypothetical protein